MSAEQCIVCLGDLAVGEPPPRHVSADLSAEALHSAAAASASPTNVPHKTLDISKDPDAIAHLLPCRHYLHNECLKPWVERANSCPLCRQSFNEVELKATLRGPRLDSYAVQDKQQVADIDPFMVIDQDLVDETLPEPCLVCQTGGDADNLLACDGCSSSYHLFCVGEEAVPFGHWFCHHCWEDGTAISHPLRAPPRSQRTHTRPTGLPGLRRRRNAIRQRSSSPYAALRSTIHQRANLDLDFPFPEETVERATDDAETRIWSRRLNIAERQGAASHFRESANAILSLRNGRQNRTPTPTAEQQEEKKAWQAFENARGLQHDGQQVRERRARRPSATASPVERPPKRPSTTTSLNNDPVVETNAQRPLKRPRIGRFTTCHVDAVDKSSGDATRLTGAPSSRLDASSSRTEGPPGPSFLQSLLAEVQQSSENSDRRQSRPVLNILKTTPLATDHTSHASMSPVSSPAASAHSSPRHLSPSPPPGLHSRPTSPTPLSCSIEPVYTRHQPFSPASPGNSLPVELQNHGSLRHPVHRQRACKPAIASTSMSSNTKQTVNNRDQSQAMESGQIATTTTSTTSRTEMTFDAKNEIRNMVSTALKPFFRSNAIDTDQYTNINREVSRQLYDRVGSEGGIKTTQDRIQWREIAVAEVEAAMKQLTAVRA